MSFYYSGQNGSGEGTVDSAAPDTVSRIGSYKMEGPYQHDQEDTQKSRRRKIGRSYVKTLSDFGNVTTAHGWGRVTLAQNRKVKFVWLILTLGALAINILHVSVLVAQYLNFPVEQLAEVHVSDIEFPSVTVCNIQPISLTTVRDFIHNESTKLFYWNNITKHYFGNNVAANIQADFEYDVLYNRVRQPIGFFENIGNESQLVGHQLKDFMLDCTFGASRCNYENVSYFQSPQYYNCYTFNGGNTSKENLVVKTTGPQAGLSLILYLESDNGDFLYNGTYFTYGNVANAAGVRVEIHSPNTKPSPIDHGFDIPPGYSTSVGVRAIKHQRLGPPYGECREDMSWELGNGKYIYSSHSCLMACQQQYIMDFCSCISADLPVPPAASTRHLTYCGYFKPEYPQAFFDNLSCEMNISMQFMGSKDVQDQCDCKSPCDEYAYDTKISFASWPVDFVQQSFYEIYVENHPEAETLKAYQNLGQLNMTQLIFYGFIRKNFVRLNVYLESLVVLEYVQRESYTFYSLWSDIGGTFGLWIGMSILTWVEVLELLINLIIRSFRIER